MWHSAVRTGIVGGTVFFLHALIPNSGSYPFIWPVLTGAVGFWIATNDAAPGRIQRGIQATFVAALIVGLIAFVGSTITVLALSRPVLNPIARAYGASPSSVTSTAERAVGMVALVAVAITLLGGVVMIPVRLWRSS
jgi:uncharacterized membrane protein